MSKEGKFSNETKCPKCTTKLNLKKLMRIAESNKSKEMNCPYCGTKIGTINN